MAHRSNFTFRFSTDKLMRQAQALATLHKNQLIYHQAELTTAEAKNPKPSTAELDDIKQKIVQCQDLYYQYERYANCFRLALSTGNETAKGVEIDVDDVEFFKLTSEEPR